MVKRGQNEGSISKRKDGLLMGRVSMPNGTRKAVYARTRAELKKKMDLLHNEADRLALAIPGTDYATMGQFFQAWLTGVEHSRDTTTSATYRYYIKHYCSELCPIPPGKLNAAHIQQLYAKRFAENLSSTTVRHIHAVLHSAFELAVRQGVLVRNPTDMIDAPRFAHHEQQTWNVNEVCAFLEAIKGDRYEALFVLALSTGMRQGELFGLRWNAVDLAHRSLQVTGNLQRINHKLVVKSPKTTASTHTVCLTEHAINALATHYDRQQTEREAMGDKWHNKLGLVFCSTLGTPVQRRNVIARHYEPAITKAGITDIRFHDMRHTTATLLLEAGIHPKVVSEMLGHSSVKVTMDLYARVTPPMHHEATVILDQIFAGNQNPLIPAVTNSPIERDKRQHWSVVSDIIRLMVDGDIEQAKLYVELLVQRLEENGDYHAQWIRLALQGVGIIYPST